MIVPGWTGAIMIRQTALWAALAVLSFPAPVTAGSATCIWENLTQTSRDRAMSQYKPDGSIGDDDAPADEEFQRAAAACGGGEMTDETLSYVIAAAGGIALKQAAGARLKTLAGVDEDTLEGPWRALSSKQREAVEQYMLDIGSDAPRKEDDNRAMLFTGLYVLAGWIPVPEDQLLPHYMSYYAGLAAASTYEKLF